MGSKRLSRLIAIDIMNLHGLMKDYVVLGDKVDGVQYADYKAGWDDDRMARLAREKMGRHVSNIQVRNLRHALFGVMRTPKLPQPKPMVNRANDLRLMDRINHLEHAVSVQAGFINELREAQNRTRDGLWNKYNELLARVRALDAEWSTCRPANYRPGLPEIINDTKEAP